MELKTLFLIENQQKKNKKEIKVKEIKPKGKTF
jgi:hypothetical protein